MKCKLTARQLKMPSELILIDRQKQIRPDIIAYMDAKHLTSAPLVRIFRDGELVDEWSDFNVDKIQEWAH